MTGSAEYHEISCHLLGISERNPQSSSKADDRLVASVQSVGVLQPLVVCPTSSTEYAVLAGARRLAAAIEAGLETVPCVVRHLDSDAEASTISISENLHRRNVEPLEEAEAIRKMVSEDGLARPDVAAALGISESTVDRRLQLSLLHQSVRAVYRKENSPIAHFSTRMLEFVATLEDQFQESLADGWMSDFGGQPNSLEDLVEIVDRHTRSLGEVGWTMEEKDLGGMRSCEGCPHNTATRPTLFDDLDYESAKCMNEECFSAKDAAHRARRYEEAGERHGAELVVVNSRWGDRPGVDVKPLDSFEWEESDGSSSFPAFDLSNPDRTDLRVAVKTRQQSSTPSAAAAKADPKAALKRAETMLTRKRFRHATPKLVEAIENAEPPKLEVLADLVAAAGGPVSRDRRHHDVGKLRLPKDRDERIEILWESVRNILVRRLDTKQTFDDFAVLGADCELIAEIIGVAWKELWKEALEACPPSKALIRRREEAAA